MKKWSDFLLVATMLVATPLLAQHKTPTVSVVPKKPVVTVPPLSPTARDFNIRFRKSILQVKKDQKKGKLTKEQVQQSLMRAKQIRVQELEFFRQNGTKDLTPSQLVGLNQSLANLESTN